MQLSCDLLALDGGRKQEQVSDVFMVAVAHDENRAGNNT
jgi:hypothetical protein